MRNKLKIGAISLVAGITLGSQAFAVQYAPNLDSDVEVDNIIALPSDDVEMYEYTQEDINVILDVYSSQSLLTKEEFLKYDMNKDGVINSIDAALVMDLMSENK